MSEHTVIRYIELRNFRCFDELTVDFDPRLTVLVAHNGEGKTAVLDAIAIALSSFVGVFPNGRLLPITTSDVRLKIVTARPWRMEPQTPTEIKIKGKFGTKPASWVRHRSISGRTNRPRLPAALDICEAVKTEQDVTLPLIAYYGTGRLYRLLNLTERKIFSSAFLFSRTAGYLDSLTPASSFRYFADWFAYAAKADASLRDRAEEQTGTRPVETEYTHQIRAIRQAVDTCLEPTGWQGLRYGFEALAVVAEHQKHGVMPIAQLSDGIRNMVALVADIAYRAVRLNPDFGAEAALLTPGIVLIDEVDMHLHPEWQQHVLALLGKAFPRMQFIVTTHSPQVLSTVRRENIRLLGRDVHDRFIAAIPAAHTYGRSNADVMQAVMGVDPEPETEFSAELDQYLAEIEQGDWRLPVLRDLRTKLDAQLGPDHPALRRADMTMRRREALEK